MMFIISALSSFFTGAIFRMIWGEASAALTKWQDNSNEIKRMEIQERIDAAQHARNMDAIKLQHDMGVDTIRVQAESTNSTIEAQARAGMDAIETGAWGAVVESTTKSTGIKIVDAWNASIRPGVATWAVLMLTLEGIPSIHMTLSVMTLEVCSAALGIYLADRTLMKRGK